MQWAQKLSAEDLDLCYSWGELNGNLPEWWQAGGKTTALGMWHEDCGKAVLPVMRVSLYLIFRSSALPQASSAQQSSRRASWGDELSLARRKVTETSLPLGGGSNSHGTDSRFISTELLLGQMITLGVQMLFIAISAVQQGMREIAAAIDLFS